MFGWALLAGVYGVMSLITFVVFALDKRAARAGQWRVPEKTLHTLELLGGFPGAWAAMVLVRHKNRKIAFVAVTLGITLLHAAGWWVWLVRGAAG